jgi:hypothetical protein
MDGPVFTGPLSLSELSVAYALEAIRMAEIRKVEVV